MRRRLPPLLPLRAAVATALALAAPRLHAQTSVATALNYFSFGSVWGAGAPTTYTTTTNWGKSYSVGKSVDGGDFFSWDVSGSANASYNFASSAQISGGSLSAGFSGRAETRVDAPREIRAGDRIDIDTRISGAQTQLSTSDADFGMRSVFSGSFDADVKAKGCIDYVGCESTSKGVDASVANRELVAVNWNGDGQFRWAGTQFPVRFGQPFVVPGGYGAIMADVPQIDGQSATGGTKASTLFEDRSMLHVAVDPVKAALALSRKGFPCITDCSFKIPVIDKKFKWTLIDLDVFLDIGLRQSVDLVMHPFTVLDFSAPVQYRDQSGAWTTSSRVRVDGWDADMRFLFPDVDDLTVHTSYGMTGTVTNRTYMTFTGSGHIEALEARLDGHGFGPLLDQSIPGVGGSVKLYDQSFDVDFGTLQGSELFLAMTPPPPGPPAPPPPPPTDEPQDPGPTTPQDEPTPAPGDQLPADPEPTVDATAAPEPATIVLLAAGLAVIGAGARRRRTR